MHHQPQLHQLKLPPKQKQQQPLTLLHLPKLHQKPLQPHLHQLLHLQKPLHLQKLQLTPK